MALSKALKKKAESNTNITFKNSDKEVIDLKVGDPLSHALKTDPYSHAKIGMSKGVTRNMANYESLRVDVWLSDEVQDGESVNEAYTRISAVIEEVLEEAVMSVCG